MISAVAIRLAYPLTRSQTNCIRRRPRLRLINEYRRSLRCADCLTPTPSTPTCSREAHRKRVGDFRQTRLLHCTVAIAPVRVGLHDLSRSTATSHTLNPLAAAHSRIGPTSARDAVEPVLMRCGRRARCPSPRRAAAMYGAKMSRSFSALSLLRSILRATPSSANEIDSWASVPSCGVPECCTCR